MIEPLSPLPLLSSTPLKNDLAGHSSFDPTLPCGGHRVTSLFIYAAFPGFTLWCGHCDVLAGGLLMALYRDESARGFGGQLSEPWRQLPLPSGD